MGCVILSYGTSYQLPCKGNCGHFRGLLWSMGIAMQPHIAKQKEHLPVIGKPVVSASVFTSLKLCHSPGKVTSSIGQE